MNSFQKKWIEVNYQQENVLKVFHLVSHIVSVFLMLLFTCLSFTKIDPMLIYIGSILIIVISALNIVICGCLIFSVEYSSDLIEKLHVDALAHTYKVEKCMIAYTIKYKIPFWTKAICIICLFSSFNWVLTLFIGIYLSSILLASYLSKFVCRKFIEKNINPISVAIVEGISYED